MSITISDYFDLISDYLGIWAKVTDYFDINQIKNLLVFTKNEY